MDIGLCMVYCMELKKKILSPLEHWILHHAPVTKSTRERFFIFQDQLQKYLKNDIKMASIPCGLMDDLLSLDYSHIANAELTGIDLDGESLDLAQRNAKNIHNDAIQIAFHQRNAWDLNIIDKFNIIASNGLNIYEPDESKVIALYHEFWKALTTGGILITSFLTPPPALSSESTWKNVNPADALKQKALFVDIIQASWQAFSEQKNKRDSN